MTIAMEDDQKVAGITCIRYIVTRELVLQLSSLFFSITGLKRLALLPFLDGKTSIFGQDCHF